MLKLPEDWQHVEAIDAYFELVTRQGRRCDLSRKRSLKVDSTRSRRRTLLKVPKSLLRALNLLQGILCVVKTPHHFGIEAE
jgi:hypothetical protein